MGRPTLLVSYVSPTPLSHHLPFLPLYHITPASCQHHHPNSFPPNPSPRSGLTGNGSYIQIPPLAKSSVSNGPVIYSQKFTNTKFPSILTRCGNSKRRKIKAMLLCTMMPRACSRKKSTESNGRVGGNCVMLLQACRKPEMEKAMSTLVMFPAKDFRAMNLCRIRKLVGAAKQKWNVSMKHLLVSDCHFTI
jgi:hypothetical protein